MASSATEWDPDDTSLMLHMDGADASTTFTDETGKTVTANGNAQIDTAQSKFGGAAALFDGAGDYLTVSGSADWDLGTGDFTIDFWFRSAIESPNIDYRSGGQQGDLSSKGSYGLSHCGLHTASPASIRLLLNCATPS